MSWEAEATPIRVEALHLKFTIWDGDPFVGRSVFPEVVRNIINKQIAP